MAAAAAAAAAMPVVSDCPIAAGGQVAAALGPAANTLTLGDSGGPLGPETCAMMETFMPDHIRAVYMPCKPLYSVAILSALDSADCYPDYGKYDIVIFRRQALLDKNNNPRSAQWFRELVGTKMDHRFTVVSNTSNGATADAAACKIAFNSSRFSHKAVDGVPLGALPSDNFGLLALHQRSSVAVTLECIKTGVEVMFLLYSCAESIKNKANASCSLLSGLYAASQRTESSTAKCRAFIAVLDLGADFNPAVAIFSKYIPKHLHRSIAMTYRHESSHAAPVLNRIKSAVGGYSHTETYVLAHSVEFVTVSVENDLMCAAHPASVANPVETRVKSGGCDSKQLTGLPPCAEKIAKLGVVDDYEWGGSTFIFCGNVRRPLGGPNSSGGGGSKRGA